VLYQRLAVLQHSTHCYYSDDPKLPSLHDIDDMKTCLLFSLLQKCMVKINSAISETIIPVTDATAVTSDVVEGDDVAQIRSKMYSKDYTNLEDDAENNYEPEMSYTYLHNPPEMIHQNNIEANDYIQAIADAFGVELPQKKNKNHLWKSRREPLPLNEFEEMHELLCCAFPEVFMLGRSYQRTSLPTTKQIRHLLLQFTAKAATSRELLFYLYDTKSRHSVISNFSSKVKQDPQAFQKFSKLVSDEVFLEKIKEAARDTSTKTAKEVLRTVLPILSFGSKQTLAGAFGDSGIQARGIATSLRHTAASQFLTLTPDDVNNPTSFRMAYSSQSNQCFPSAVSSSFAATYQNSGIYNDTTDIGDIQVPLSFTHRLQAAQKNPVAIACEFQALMENVIQILIGCPLDFQAGTDSNQKRTWYFKSSASNNPHHKGIYGNVTAVYGSIETQARGALHFHILIYGGLNPKLLEDVTGHESLTKAISSVLSAMYNAELPRSVHIEDILIKQL